MLQSLLAFGDRPVSAVRCRTGRHVRPDGAGTTAARQAADAGGACRAVHDVESYGGIMVTAAALLNRRLSLAHFRDIDNRKAHAASCSSARMSFVTSSTARLVVNISRTRACRSRI